MWQCLSERLLGALEERVEELAKERKRPGGRQVLRADSEGRSGISSLRNQYHHLPGRAHESILGHSAILTIPSLWDAQKPAGYFQRRLLLRQPLWVRLWFLGSRLEWLKRDPRCRDQS